MPPIWSAPQLRLLLCSTFTQVTHHGCVLGVFAQGKGRQMLRSRSQWGAGELERRLLSEHGRGGLGVSTPLVPSRDPEQQGNGGRSEPPALCLQGLSSQQRCRGERGLACREFRRNVFVQKVINAFNELPKEVIESQTTHGHSGGRSEEMVLLQARRRQRVVQPRQQCCSQLTVPEKQAGTAAVPSLSPAKADLSDFHRFNQNLFSLLACLHSGVSCSAHHGCAKTHWLHLQGVGMATWESLCSCPVGTAEAEAVGRVELSLL